MAALTRQELKDLEAKEKTELEKAFDILIQCLPNVCGLLAILEYLLTRTTAPTGIRTPILDFCCC